MKVSRRAIERVSGASTLSVFAGLAALAVLAVPSGVPHLVKLAAPGSAGAATAAPQSSMQAAPLQASSAVKVVRTKSVSIPIEKEEASGNSPEIIAVAARTGRKLGTTGEAVPETTWDGQPHKTITPSPPAAAPAQPAVAPVAVPSATPPKKGDSPAKAAPAVPVQPGAADASLAPVVEEWTAAEVAGALKECLKLMGPVDAEIEPIEAMKKGP